MTMYKLGRISKEELSRVNPILKQLAEEAIKISTVDFGIIRGGGLRTEEQQYQYYKEGKSRCDGKRNKSYHQSGNAVDLVPYIDGAYTWSNPEAFNAIHRAVMTVWSRINTGKYRLIWGSDWSTFKDSPHYELRVA